MARHSVIDLDEYVARLERDRADFDMEGWAEAPVKTFACAAPPVDGGVTDEDQRIAAGIRERVWALRGRRR